MSLLRSRLRHIVSADLKLWIPLYTVLLMVIIWTYSLWSSYTSTVDYNVRSNIKYAEQDVASLVREMNNFLEGDESHRADQALRARGVNIGYELLIALDNNDRVMFSTNASHLGQHISEINSRASLFYQTADGNGISSGFNPGLKHIYVSAPLTLAPIGGQIRSLSRGRVLLVYSIELYLQNAIRESLNNSALAALLLLLLSSATGLVVYRFVKLPTDYLLKTANKIAIDETKTRARIHGTGEFKRLGDALNNMAAKLISRAEEREHAYTESHHKDKILNEVFSVMPDVFVLINDDAKILDLRVSRYSSFDYLSSKDINRSIYASLPSSLQTLLSVNIGQLCTTNHLVSFEIDILKQKRKHYFEIRLLMSSANRILVVFREITGRKEAELKLNYQAHYDELTGLANRAFLSVRMNQLIQQNLETNRKFALLFIDLDNFKDINDLLGHEIGDKLLKETATRLYKLIGNSDLLARLGGDEFVVLLADHASVNDYCNNAKKIIDSLTRQFIISNNELFVSCSIGVVIYPDDGRTMSTLMRKADSAMYKAKAQGKGRFTVYDDTIDREITRRYLVERHLRRALEKSQLEVHYQPQYDLALKRIVSVEGLLRWNCPELGPIGPAEFIPVAEQSGLIVAIGEFIFEQVATFIRLQLDKEEPIRVSMNLSPRQLREPDFVQSLVAKTSLYDIPRHLLELEITETILLSNEFKASECLEALHNFGFKLAMDDFGTGYSSLSYLRQYPFDNLKIDREFVWDINKTNEANSLIKAMITIAKELNMRVIAEGVETEEQVDFLNSAGCDLIQGFYIGKAMSVSDLTQLLAPIAEQPSLDSSHELENQ